MCTVTILPGIPGASTYVPHGRKKRNPRSFYLIMVLGREDDEGRNEKKDLSFDKFKKFEKITIHCDELILCNW